MRARERHGAKRFSRLRYLSSALFPFFQSNLTVPDAVLNSQMPSLSSIVTTAGSPDFSDQENATAQIGRAHV